MNENEFDGRCPNCGGTRLTELAGNIFDCIDCGTRINPEEMGIKEKHYIYILEEYPFYEGSTILIVSDRYIDVKTTFDNIANKKGYGYHITKYELGVYYEEGKSQDMDWIEIDDEGKIKDILNITDQPIEV